MRFRTSLALHEFVQAHVPVFGQVFRRFHGDRPSSLGKRLDPHKLRCLLGAKANARACFSVWRIVSQPIMKWSGTSGSICNSEQNRFQPSTWATNLAAQ